MLWQKAQIVVAGIHQIGLIGKNETPVTGAKSNTTKLRRESCRDDKIACLLCRLELPLQPLPTNLTTFVFYDNTSFHQHGFPGLNKAGRTSCSLVASH